MDGLPGTCWNPGMGLVRILVATAALLASVVGAATPRELLTGEPTAREVLDSFGRKNLENGRVRHRIEGRVVAWAAVNKEAITIRNRSEESVIGKMQSLGEGVQLLVRELPNCVEFDYAATASSGKEAGEGHLKIEYYPFTADSNLREGVPRGTLEEHSWNDSKVFPGTERDFLVYVPAQYDPSDPAGLLVFQDGLRHADREGPMRVPTVMDNLIHSGEVPVAIGVFINPGRKKGQDPKAKPANRSFEYDSLGDQYARFLHEEILPFVEKKYNLSKDPKLRCIAGGSSGAICAWTVAWERPDSFQRVVSWVGTYVDIRGGHNYPPMIRQADPKPIRVYLLAEEKDLDNQFGNWPLANRQMAKALAYRGYDFTLEFGPGFHGSRHAGVRLPDMLRWVWRDWK